jgi:parallel beta-helix repeat protein
MGQSWSNLIANNEITNFGSPILLSAAHYNVIRNNGISGSATPSLSAAINVFRSNFNQIINNQISDHEQWGIRLTGASSSNNIQANTIENCRNTGIGIYYDSDFNQIINNLIADNGIGLLIDSSSTNVLRDNWFNSNDTDSFDNGNNTWQNNFWSQHLSGLPFLVPNNAQDLAPRTSPPVISPIDVLPSGTLPPPPSTDRLTINTNTVWDTNANIHLQQLTVCNGATLTLRNASFNVDSYITIEDHASLIIENAQLIFPPETNAEFMNIEDTGHLVIRNSSLSGFGQVINAYPGSTLLVENSEFFWLGGWMRALMVWTDNAVIHNNLFHGGYSAVLIAADGVQFTQNRIEEYVYGLDIMPGDGDPLGQIVEDNTFFNIINSGLTGLGNRDWQIHDNVFQNIWGKAIDLNYFSQVGFAEDNQIWGNHFIKVGDLLDEVQTNVWFDESEQAGNFYSNYGTRYPLAEENPLLPGIWDTPYIIRNAAGTATTTDIYPRMISEVLYFDRVEAMDIDRIDLVFSRSISATDIVEDNLRNHIFFASNGYSFAKLTTADTLIIDDQRLIIHFAIPIAGNANRIKIDGGFITDGQQILSKQIKTGEFNAKKTVRVYGANRYLTAVEISKKGWPYGAQTVVLARSDEYADALAGVPLAYMLDAPILLSATQQIGTVTLDEIQRLGAEKVVILGGNAAISSTVESDLVNLGLLVERIAGTNRYNTAALIAEKMANIGSIANSAVIAVGTNFPDALAAAAYAAQNRQPILLVTENALPATTSTAITNLQLDHLIIAGGTSVISGSVADALALQASVERIAGSNRYSTAVALADYYSLTQPFYFIATGTNFPDAITGAVLAAKLGTGVLLVYGPGATPNLVVQDYVEDENVQAIGLFGGSSVISDGIMIWFQNNL